MRAVVGDKANQEAAELLVAARRKRLQKDALRRGRKLYRKSPRAFRRIIRLR
jgi:hypothetical protein